MLCEQPAMRTIAFLLVATAALGVSASGCGSDDDSWGDESSIVFGISQSTDASGKTTTTAGYEYLSLAKRGGWSTSVEMLRHDAVCIYEDLDKRIGKPNVGDGGRARFAGGSLPSDLVIDANGDDVKVDGAAFAKGQAVLFDVEGGFGLPPIGTLRLYTPTTDLSVTAPADGELSVDPKTDLTVTWTSNAPEPISRVMVALDVDDGNGKGRELRCFYDEQDGRGIVPSSSLAQLGPPGTKGKVQIASHRQVNVFARGGWTVYVVGTIQQREQPFAIAAD